MLFDEWDNQPAARAAPVARSGTGALSSHVPHTHARRGSYDSEEEDDRVPMHDARGATSMPGRGLGAMDSAGPSLPSSVITRASDPTLASIDQVAALSTA